MGNFVGIIALATLSFVFGGLATYYYLLSSDGFLPFNISLPQITIESSQGGVRTIIIPEVRSYTITVDDSGASPAGIHVSTLDKIEFVVQNNSSQPITIVAPDISLTEPVLIPASDSIVHTFEAPATPLEAVLSVTTSSEERGVAIVIN